MTKQIFNCTLVFNRSAQKAALWHILVTVRYWDVVLSVASLFNTMLQGYNRFIRPTTNSPLWHFTLQFMYVVLKWKQKTKKSVWYYKMILLTSEPVRVCSYPSGLTTGKMYQSIPFNSLLRADGSATSRCMRYSAIAGATHSRAWIPVIQLTKHSDVMICEANFSHLWNSLWATWNWRCE